MEKRPAEDDAEDEPDAKKTKEVRTDASNHRPRLVPVALILCIARHPRRTFSHLHRRRRSCRDSRRLFRPPSRAERRRRR